MLYPSIDNLLKHVDSKFQLAIIAAKRARQLQLYSNTLRYRGEATTAVGQALGELDQGLLKFRKE